MFSAKLSQESCNQQMQPNVSCGCASPFGAECTQDNCRSASKFELHTDSYNQPASVAGFKSSDS